MAEPQFWVAMPNGGMSYGTTLFLNGTKIENVSYCAVKGDHHA